MKYVEGFEPATTTEPEPSQYVPGFEPVTATATEPVTASATSGLADTINAGLKAARDWFQPAANNLVRAPGEILRGERPFLTGLEAPAEYQTPPESAVGRFAAEMVNPVPGDMTSAGAQVGTIAAGPLGIAARVAGAAGGAGLGSLASGKDYGDAARDAGLYGAGAGITEGATALLSKLVRSLPNNPLLGGKRNIAEGDAAGYGRVMGEQSPPLAGASTAQELRDVAAGGGQQVLGDLKEQVVRAIEGRISTGPVLPMPSLGGQGMSLREANDELSRIGALAFSKNPLDRTAQGIDQRRLYGQVARDIEQGLAAIDQQAAALFSETQGVFSRGMAMIRPLQNSQAFRQGDTLEFNTPFFQRLVNSAKGEAQLTNKLGPEGYTSLADTLRRGGVPGEVDRLASGGNVQDALLDFLRRPSAGAGTLATLLPRTLLPNIGSSYAGRAPYTVPPGLQTLLDLIGERAMEQARRGQPIPIGPIP